MRPDKSRLENQLDERGRASAEEGRNVHTRELADEQVGNQQEMFHSTKEPASNGQANGRANRHEVITGPSAQDKILQDDPDYDEQIAYWEPKPPKVLMKNSEDTPLELRGQIQLYATNE